MKEIGHKELIKKTLPIAADMMLPPVMLFIELYIISHISIETVGIFGLAAQIIILIFTLFFTLNIGSSILILKYREENKSQDANHLFSHTIGIAFYLSLIIALIFYFSIPLIEKIILKSANTDIETFLKITAFAIPIIGFNFIFTGLLRSCGEGIKSFWINLIITIINLGALLIFFQNKIFFYNNGIMIAGFCLLGSNIISTLLIIFLTSINYFNLKLIVKDFINFDIHLMKDIFKRGFYLGFEQVLWASGQTYLTFLAGIFSPVILAAHNIVKAFQSLITMIYQGLGINFFIHYNDSVNKIKLFKKVLLHTFLIVILITLCFIVFQQPIIKIFVNFNKSYNNLQLSRYVKYIKEALIVMLSFQLFKSCNIIVGYGLKKLDNLKWLAMVTLASTVLFVLIGGFLMTKIFQEKIIVIWIIIGIDEVFKTIMNSYKLKKTNI